MFSVPTLNQSISIETFELKKLKSCNVLQTKHIAKIYSDWDERSFASGICLEAN